MNNNVLVTVHGLQHEIDDKEGIQTKQTGNYRHKNIIGNI